ncbi:Gene Transfer Agent terminase protein [hydrothermal vent metagenome]|uniref:Gene Transfer Agent terminase protein n=1 Tax=hydrothermal vent metagenome TaxID=652676 RepID=A0A3B0S6F1_9ZZZZ
MPVFLLPAKPHVSELAKFEPERILWAIQHLPKGAAGRILRHWPFWARPDQIAPLEAWSTWVFLGGRGAGKTRTGAEWIRHLVETQRIDAGGQSLRIALVASTMHDAREVMIEGESGIIAISCPSERPEYIASRRLLRWKNGAIAQVFSAEDADGLRGPQFHAAWADEFCAWKNPGHCLAMLRMGLRLGQCPQLFISTTPRPSLAMKTLLDEPELVLSRAKTRDNPHLSRSFLHSVEALYGNSVLGRQELGGELINDPVGGLWRRSQIEQAIGTAPEQFDRIVVAVDPPAGAGKSSAACGIIVAGTIGTADDKTAWVLADRTVQGVSPSGWAKAVARAWQDFEADRVVAEANQGGEMVRTVLQLADHNLPVTLVHARRGKRLRAEPVAALYERAKVKHADRFPELEDQMCCFGTAGFTISPDRMDALVWAIWSLMLDGAGTPRVRML